MDQGVKNSIIAILVILVVSLFMTGYTFKGTYRELRHVLNFYFRASINRFLIIRTIEPQYKRVLEATFYYYHALDQKNRKLFEKRVQKFIDQKLFLPAGGLKKVTAEMRTLISASAIQITFGLPGVYFKNFKKIYVYPEFYFSEGMQQYNAGEVHKAGVIMLSWLDFVEGYANPNNARNLGLHEMAYALRLENMIRNEEFGYFDWDDIQELNKYTVIESDRINAGEESIFRAYAATYYHEFFAVLIEIFFEQPQQLQSYHPELFDVTTRLLKQDPRDPNRRLKG